MRTTVTLDDDVLAEVKRISRLEGIGLSDALNRLVRGGMARRPQRAEYVHHTNSVGLKIDVSNIGDVLDLLDGESGNAG